MFCPKCGEEMIWQHQELVCIRGEMGLSRVVEEALAARFAANAPTQFNDPLSIRRGLRQAESIRRVYMSELRSDIVHLETHEEFGLYRQTIFGLNIFDYNDVTCPIEQRPDVVFLTDLTTRQKCAAHVGSLALKDRVDSPEEMFGASDGSTPYLRTKIGFSDGFYDLNEWHCFDACFFPLVTPLFWQALLKGKDDLDQLLVNHGLAFYLAPNADAAMGMKKLLDSPFPGEAEWMNAVMDCYGLVLTVGHDGQYFHAYARDRATFRLLQPSLNTAMLAVEKSAWFQAHRQDLAWSKDPEDLDCCLMLQER